MFQTVPRAAAGRLDLFQEDGTDSLTRRNEARSRQPEADFGYGFRIWECPRNCGFPKIRNPKSHAALASGFCVKILPAMAVNPELLKILVCPVCKAPVNLTESGQGLKCSQCRRVYPIRDDIPVMLVSEAKVED